MRFFYLPNLILAGLWLSDSIAVSGMTAHETTSLAAIFGPKTLIATFAFAFLVPMVSNIVLSGHMAKQDGKVGAPVLPSLIWRNTVNI